MPNIENSTILNNAETKKRLHTKVLKSFYKTLSKLKLKKLISFNWPQFHYYNLILHVLLKNLNHHHLNIET
jgi:hypothetical protein